MNDNNDKKFNEQFRSTYVTIIQNILNNKKRSELEIKHGSTSSAEIDSIISKIEKMLDIAKIRYKDNKPIIGGLQFILETLKFFGTKEFKITSIETGNRYILAELERLIKNSK